MKGPHGLYYLVKPMCTYLRTNTYMQQTNDWTVLDPSRHIHVTLGQNIFWSLVWIFITICLHKLFWGKHFNFNLESFQKNVKSYSVKNSYHTGFKIHMRLRQSFCPNVHTHLSLYYSLTMKGLFLRKQMACVKRGLIMFLFFSLKLQLRPKNMRAILNTTWW